METIKDGFTKMSLFGKCTSIVASVTAVLVLLTLLFQVDERYARAGQVKDLQKAVAQISFRLEQEILSDAVMQNTKMKWMLEERLRTNPDDKDARQQLDEININILKLSSQLDTQKEKYKHETGASD